MTRGLLDVNFDDTIAAAASATADEAMPPSTGAAADEAPVDETPSTAAAAHQPATANEATPAAPQAAPEVTPGRRPGCARPGRASIPDHDGGAATTHRRAAARRGSGGGAGTSGVWTGAARPGRGGRSSRVPDRGQARRRHEQARHRLPAGGGARADLCWRPHRPTVATTARSPRFAASHRTAWWWPRRTCSTARAAPRALPAKACYHPTLEVGLLCTLTAHLRVTRRAFRPRLGGVPFTAQPGACRADDLERGRSMTALLAARGMAAAAMFPEI